MIDRGINLKTTIENKVKQPDHVIEIYPFASTDTSFDILELNQALLEREKVYNTIRPHQALKYLTPLEYLEQYWQNKRKEKKVSPMA